MEEKEGPLWPSILKVVFLYARPSGVPPMTRIRLK